MIRQFRWQINLPYSHSRSTPIFDRLFFLMGLHFHAFSVIMH